MKIFFKAYEDVVVGLLRESDIEKVADHISSDLFPKHLSMTAKKLN